MVVRPSAAAFGGQEHVLRDEGAPPGQRGGDGCLSRRRTRTRPTTGECDDCARRPAQLNANAAGIAFENRRTVIAAFSGPEGRR
jgi:hypothetical protein